MLRGMILVLGLLMASITTPPPAEARPLILKMLRGMTNPLGMTPRRHVSRRAYSRRAAASRAAAARARATAAARARPAAVAAAPVAAAGAGVAAVAATGSAAKASDTPDTANVQATGAATTGAAPAAEAAIEDASAVPLPAPAPLQRNAALATTTDDEPQARASAAPQAPPARAQSRLGTVGPLAWPTAYEDVVGFTLWPKEYGERLRVHGIGDVLSTALAPSASIAARTGLNRRLDNVRQARADDPNNAPAANIPVARSCGSVDLTAADWPIAQISSMIELTDAQRGTLDQLKTALNDAVSSIKSHCRDDANQGPVERLRAMQNALWAVHDATQLIRAPLARFYDSLTEEQKHTFTAPAQPQTGGRTLSRSDMARMCDLPASADAPMRQIEQSLRPTKAQRASLELLQKKSFEMGQFLMASCLKPMPATPAERLDAAADRLTAVIFAASNVNMALNDFTSQLSEEQKTRLNSLVR
jgi:hypothetical protein